MRDDLTRGPATSPKSERTFSAHCAPLGAIANISFKSQGGFLKGIGALEKIINDLPLGLPKEGSYVAEIKDGELHLYGRGESLQQFEVIGNKNSIISVKQNREGVTLELNVRRTPYTVHLHFSQPPISEQEVTHRTSQPWRSSQLETASEAATESRASLGQGER
jgi:hypothetical protein